MDKETVIKRIEDGKIVAVVRGETKEEAIKIVKECVENGIDIIELTFTTPFAYEAIKELAATYKDKILLGAGTVLDSETARIAILAGAKFIVSPQLSLEVIRLANRYRVANMSGIMTVTEAVKAMEAGTDILKVFPSEVLGVSFIKALKAPLPYAKLMPTGGVTPENINEWLDTGVVAVGVGSSLTKGNIKVNAKKFLNAIKGE